MNTNPNTLANRELSSDELAQASGGMPIEIHEMSGGAGVSDNAHVTQAIYDAIKQFLGGH